MAAKQGVPKQQVPAATGEMDPRFDWMDNAASYVLRLYLHGFKKDDFRVQVDGAGRLTVRGSGQHGACFHKVFQLPSAAILDDISGRFDAGVLTLTVPKRANTAPPTTIEDLIMKPVKEVDAVAKQRKDDGGAEKKDAKKKPKEEISKGDGGAEKKESAVAAKLKEDVTKVDGVHEKKESTAAKHKEEITKGDGGAEKKESAAAAKLNEDVTKVDGVHEKESAAAKLKEGISKVGADVKKKVMEEAAGMVPLPQQQQQHKQEAKKPEQTSTPMAPVKKDAKAPETGEKGKAMEQEKKMAEDRAKEAVDESEPEKKASWCGGWKELVPEDLVDMKWADDLVETARNNKELIAATIAAFSLGFLLSHKLFSRN